MNYSNPYTGESFLGFFIQFFWRMIAFIQGDLPFSELVSDEIQVLVLSGVAVSAALVGSFLVLRKMSMLANALSHTILLGVVMAFVMTRREDGHHTVLNMQVMLIAATATGLLTAFLTEFLTNTVKLQEDASVGLVFSSLFALGVVLVTVLTRNAHIGTEVVMGNVDSLRLDDCQFVYVILGINIVIFTLLYKEYKITTFDPALAKALGFSPIFFSYLLMTQVSATSIGAFRAVGVLMVLAFITGPPLTARFLTDNLKRMLVLAAILGVSASFIGVALSRHFLSVHGVAFSTAGIVVCVIVVQFILAAVYSLLKKRPVHLPTSP